jgi:hypothetical protein
MRLLLSDQITQPLLFVAVEMRSLKISPEIRASRRCLIFLTRCRLVGTDKGQLALPLV